ncbi:MAG: DUF1318 domain-containing protein [Candidatus Paracaedibacter sp.]
MIKQLALILLGIMVISPTSAGMDLATALSSKKVCERTDGFIQATPGNEKEVANLAVTINAKRSKVYADIATKDGLDPAAVGMTMAEHERAINPGKFCR